MIGKSKSVLLDESYLRIPLYFFAWVWYNNTIPF